MLQADVHTALEPPPNEEQWCHCIIPSFQVGSRHSSANQTLVYIWTSGHRLAEILKCSHTQLYSISSHWSNFLTEGSDYIDLAAAHLFNGRSPGGSGGGARGAGRGKWTWMLIKKGRSALDLTPAASETCLLSDQLLYFPFLERQRLSFTSFPFSLTHRLRASVMSIVCTIGIVRIFFFNESTVMPTCISSWNFDHLFCF